MYLSFYSFQGSSITVTVTYPEIKKANRIEEFSLEELKEREKQAKISEIENQQLVHRCK